MNGKQKPKQTYLTTEMLPTLRHTVKPDIDKETARSLIIELVKVIGEITTRLYDFQNKEKKNNGSEKQTK